MQFLLLVATDQQPGEPAEQAGELDQWLEEGERRDLTRGGDQLAAVSTAVTVRVRQGEVLVADGPFTESKEWIVGFDLIECASVTEAVDYVSRHPMARRGRIEVRQIITAGD